MPRGSPLLRLNALPKETSFKITALKEQATKRRRQVHELGGGVDLYVEISKLGQLNAKTKCQLVQKPTVLICSFQIFGDI
jgi:hypothetical protein